MGTQEKEQELEFLDLDMEVKEFVRKKPLIKEEKKKPSHLWLVLLPAAMLMVALCGILWLKLPVAMVLLIVVLEALLAVFLSNSPIWLHGLVVILNLVLGIIFKWTVFMLLAELVYLAQIISAHYHTRR